MVSSNSVFRTGNNYFPQVFLEQCKYVVKEKKMLEYINDNIEISSDREDSDEENSNKKNSDEDIMRRIILIRYRMNLVFILKAFR